MAINIKHKDKVFTHAVTIEEPSDYHFTNCIFTKDLIIGENVKTVYFDMVTVSGRVINRYSKPIYTINSTYKTVISVLGKRLSREYLDYFNDGEPVFKHRRTSRFDICG